MPQSFSAFEHEPDHIIPVQHGGNTQRKTWLWHVYAVIAVKDPTSGHSILKLARSFPSTIPASKSGKNISG